MMRLGAKVNLVVCQKSKVQDWVEHFKKYYEESRPFCLITDLTKTKANDIKYHFKHWVKDAKEHAFPHVYVINYDLIWRRPELITLEDFTLLLDESSMIQHETAKRSKFILKMKPAHVILLSGTPTGGKYENLWSQMRLLGWKISKSTYWNQYVEVEYLDTFGGRSIPIVVGYKRVDRLKAKMAEHGCRFLKTEEVMGLPEQTFTNVYCKTSKEYRTFRKRRLVTVGDTELVGDTSLTQMLYERQLCGMYCKEKLDAFRDLLESTEDRVVVFYNFTEEWHLMGAITDEMGRHRSVINGDHKSLYNYDNYDDTVTFVQYKAGAMGINLQLSNKVVYFSLPLSSELFEQSKKRIHRIGQERPCFYYIMMCRNSIEERILRTLKMRQDYTEKLFEKEE